ncbi:MAG: DUF4197 domain-containing protein [Hyphomonadaceae bacterium]|nr:DUF4197 domain-containing protein [Hyphomonadaceae bacterium]
MKNQFDRRAFIAGLIVATPAFAQRPLLDGLTQGDASRGIKEALSLASMNATNRLAQPNGFWGNPRVRIPLPGVLGQTQRTLSRMRMSGPLDQLQENLNHAAESVMPQAASLFTNAVRTITIADAIDIVRGGDTSATSYLRGRTETRLTTLLRPPMTRALTDSGAFALMRTALREVGMSSMTSDLRTEVINFSTAKALDGCFYFIAEEERAIRRDPWRRTSDILRRVFG